MGERISRFAEIVVQIVSSRCEAMSEVHSSANTEDTELKKTYKALIYTNLNISGLKPPATDDSDNYKCRIAGFPLAGCEQVTFLWGKYREYLSAFIAGERAAFAKLWDILPGLSKKRAEALEIRNTFFKAAPALRAIFSGEIKTDRPIRIWWSTSSPELSHLPWELLAYGERKDLKHEFSFVRGIPATPIPKIPISGRLRLAFIHEVEHTPAGLLAALNNLPKDENDVPIVEVVPMTEKPMEALQRAVREGYELIHIVADGTVSLAREGILYLRKTPSSPEQQLGPGARRTYRALLHVARIMRGILPDNLIYWLNNKLYMKLEIETCSPGQLSGLLRGSRVAVLSLTALRSDSSDPARLDGFLLPFVYKAFAYLGNSALTLPNIVAPLGACSDEQLQSFWQTFYVTLAKSKSVEAAMVEAQKKKLIAPIALFLRQRLGREFTVSKSTSNLVKEHDPVHINAELVAARDLLEYLRAVDSKYTYLEGNITRTRIIEFESTRQYRLEQDLLKWTQLEDSEL